MNPSLSSVAVQATSAGLATTDLVALLALSALAMGGTVKFGPFVIGGRPRRRRKRRTTPRY